MLKYKKWHKELNMAKSSTSLTPHIEILRDKYSNLKESPFYREIQLNSSIFIKHITSNMFI